MLIYNNRKSKYQDVIDLLWFLNHADQVHHPKKGKAAAARRERWQTQSTGAVRKMICHLRAFGRFELHDLGYAIYTVLERLVFKVYGPDGVEYLERERGLETPNRRVSISRPMFDMAEYSSTVKEQGYDSLATFLRYAELVLCRHRFRELADQTGLGIEAPEYTTIPRGMGRTLQGTDRMCVQEDQAQGEGHQGGYLQIQGEDDRPRSHSHRAGQWLKNAWNGVKS